jgi:hypothetical protein
MLAGATVNPSAAAATDVAQQGISLPAPADAAGTDLAAHRQQLTAERDRLRKLVQDERDQIQLAQNDLNSSQKALQSIQQGGNAAQITELQNRLEEANTNLVSKQKQYREVQTEAASQFDVTPPAFNNVVVLEERDQRLLYLAGSWGALFIVFAAAAAFTSRSGPHDQGPMPVTRGATNGGAPKPVLTADAFAATPGTRSRSAG